MYILCSGNTIIGLVVKLEVSADFQKLFSSITVETTTTIGKNLNISGNY